MSVEANFEYANISSPQPVLSVERSIFTEEMLVIVAASTINRVRAHVLALLGANTNDWRNGSSAQVHGASDFVKWLWRWHSQNKLDKQITKIACIGINICVLNVVY